MKKLIICILFPLCFYCQNVSAYHSDGTVCTYSIIPPGLSWVVTTATEAPEFPVVNVGSLYQLETAVMHPIAISSPDLIDATTLSGDSLFFNGVLIQFISDAGTTDLAEFLHPAPPGMEWTGYISSLPIPLSSDNTTIDFDIIFFWDGLSEEQAAAATGSYWFSDTADDLYGESVTDIFIPLDVATIPNVPTLSQWGIAILGLLLLTLGSVSMIRQRQTVLAGSVNVSSNGKLSLIEPKLFKKVVQIALPFVIGGFAIISFIENGVYLRNLIGVIISGLIISYLIHFVIMSKKSAHSNS
jgi:hypothetical protein